MDLFTSLAFLGAIFIFMATPGPGVLAVVSRALGSGLPYALSMSVGMVVGDIVFLLLSIYGLSIVASKFYTLFLIVKISGGLYLVYIGYKMFISKNSSFLLQKSKKRGLFGDFLSGLFITLSNPKVIAFYIGFLPTFVDLQNITFKDTVIVVTMVLTTLVFILSFYAYFASKAKENIKNPKIGSIINKTAGISMMAVGGLLLMKR